MSVATVVHGDDDDDQRRNQKKYGATSPPLLRLLILLLQLYVQPHLVVAVARKASARGKLRHIVASNYWSMRGKNMAESRTGNSQKERYLGVSRPLTYRTR